MRSFIRSAAVAASAAIVLLGLPAAMASASSKSPLRWSPAASSSYGTVGLGDSVSRVFTLTNHGSKATGSLKVSLTGSAAFKVTKDSCKRVRLRAHRSCKVTVTFSPTLGQSVDAKLAAASAKPAMKASLTLTGTAVKASPAIQTTPEPASAAPNSPVSDAATVTGGYSPSGTVTFSLYSDLGCSVRVFTDTETLAAGSATSKTYTPTAPGTYNWVATYNGDGANNAVSSSCGDGSLTITGCLVTDVTSAKTYTGLQAAVTAASVGDDLDVQGTCPGLIEIAKNLHLATPVQFSPATLSGPGPDSVPGIGSVLTIDSSATVTVNNLTITGGNGGGAPNGDGGGITNNGTLTLTSVTVTGNFANEGGGIFNDGMLTLSDTTITGNTANVGSGGGILNVNNDTGDPGSESGLLLVTNSTIGGSSGTGNAATDGQGGGIYNDNGNVTLTTSTVTFNTAGAEDPVNGGFGGGIYDYNNAAGNVENVNSTIVNNTPDQCFGPVTNPEHQQAC